MRKIFARRRGGLEGSPESKGYLARRFRLGAEAKITRQKVGREAKLLEQIGLCAVQATAVACCDRPLVVGDEWALALGALVQINHALFFPESTQA